MKGKSFTLVMCFFFILFSCKKENEEIKPETRGTTISVTYSGEYTVSQLNMALVVAQVSLNQTLKYNVRMFKVLYRTKDSQNKIVQASGTLYVPQTNTASPLLSFQHGTQTKRAGTAYTTGIYTAEGLAGFITASLGYVCCVPDYLGLGTSELLHPYLIADLSASVVVDMLAAVKSYCAENSIALNNQIFLAGYSEGGFVTLAAQKEIETNYADSFQLTATAPAAGPCDLTYTTESVFAAKTYIVPAYAGFLLYSYNTYYRFTQLNSIFTPAYADKIPLLFDGTKTQDEINAQLTSDLNSLLTQSFINDYLQKQYINRLETQNQNNFHTQ
jgi:hypothetical protein